MKRWWISMSKETGQQGTLLLEAESANHAEQLAKQYPESAGCELLIIEMPPGDIGIEVEWRRFEKNRVYSKSEVAAMGYATVPSDVSNKLAELHPGKFWLSQDEP